MFSGVVVCHDCSFHRYRLNHVATDKDVRVCNECYGILSNPSSPR
jgi:hypothetical protein